MSREISPLDGRYAGRLRRLGDIFSEVALVRARCRVELKWIEALSETGLFPPLSGDELDRVHRAGERFDDADFLRIKEIEGRITHDVKACERFLVEKLRLGQPHLVHFGLTSEDVNNLAYSLLLDEYRTRVQVPLVSELMSVLAVMTERWKTTPFPARTHGQLASPTTAGKEMAVFLWRLLRQCRALEAIRFPGKLGGATGNCSALHVAAPGVDWLDLSRRFVEGLGLAHNPVTTQIEDHDTWAEYFGLVARINTIVLDLDRDCWSYVALGYLVQRAKEGEVGSSTMPHKVNPINFENSEGNVTLSNALLHALSDKLCASRMQRDLSDSTVERNMGVALAHSHLAIAETIEGLRKVEVDADSCRRELEDAPELLSEPYQTLLKTAGVDDPYELLRRASRGTRLELADLHRLAADVDVPPDVRDRLVSLRVADYVGLAPRLCDLVLEEYERSKKQ
jgi:adenylosuccinate lyase